MWSRVLETWRVGCLLCNKLHVLCQHAVCVCVCAFAEALTLSRVPSSKEEVVIIVQVSVLGGWVNAHYQSTETGHEEEGRSGTTHCSAAVCDCSLLCVGYVRASNPSIHKLTTTLNNISLVERQTDDVIIGPPPPHIPKPDLVLNCPDHFVENQQCCVCPQASPSVYHSAHCSPAHQHLAVGVHEIEEGITCPPSHIPYWQWRRTQWLSIHLHLLTGRCPGRRSCLHSH